MGRFRVLLPLRLFLRLLLLLLRLRAGFSIDEGAGLVVVTAAVFSTTTLTPFVYGSPTLSSTTTAVTTWKIVGQGICNALFQNTVGFIGELVTFIEKHQIIVSNPRLDTLVASES